MICKDVLVGAAGQTAPTNGLEPPLQIISVVVVGEGVAERGRGRSPRDGRVMGGEAERRRREARRGHGGGHPRRVPGGRPGQGPGAQLGGRAGSVGRRERGGPRRERARLRAGKIHGSMPMPSASTLTVTTAGRRSMARACAVSR